jgi:integrase
MQIQGRPADSGAVVATSLAALNPDVVDPIAAAAIQALLREGESANTVASYRAALRYWAAWYYLRYGKTLDLPASVPSVLQFVVDHAQRQAESGELAHELPEAIDRALVEGGFKRRFGPPSLNTLLHRVAVLSWAHARLGHLNPCHDAAVRELVARTRRAYAKRGDLPQRKTALTRDPLEALLATCDHTLRGRRDRALLLFAWASGGRRRSEVTRATLENTRKVADLTWVYTLAQSKGNQDGEDRPENSKPIVGVAAEALEAWLKASGIRSGPIFRRVRKGSIVGEPLTPEAVRQIVKARCQAAKLVGDFSAHSLRSGFVTEAGAQDVSLGETMAMTGHRNVAAVMPYFRAGAATTSRAARLLEGRPAD